ncbi:MAG: hypothetical protein HZA34_00470 [Candidatus Pacebacteria bacterium]|nr:hypothetical protein [Candidatus Paceibacterota bacterium]
MLNTIENVVELGGRIIASKEELEKKLKNGLIIVVSTIPDEMGVGGAGATTFRTKLAEICNILFVEHAGAALRKFAYEYFLESGTPEQKERMKSLDPRGDFNDFPDDLLAIYTEKFRGPEQDKHVDKGVIDRVIQKLRLNKIVENPTIVCVDAKIGPLILEKLWELPEEEKPAILFVGVHADTQETILRQLQRENAKRKEMIRKENEKRKTESLSPLEFVPMTQDELLAIRSNRLIEEAKRYLDAYGIEYSKESMTKAVHLLINSTTASPEKQVEELLTYLRMHHPELALPLLNQLNVGLLKIQQLLFLQLDIARRLAFAA